MCCQLCTLANKEAVKVPRPWCSKSHNSKLSCPDGRQSCLASEDLPSLLHLLLAYLTHSWRKIMFIYLFVIGKYATWGHEVLSVLFFKYLFMPWTVPNTQEGREGRKRWEKWREVREERMSSVSAPAPLFSAPKSHHCDKLKCAQPLPFIKCFCILGSSQ